MSTDIGIVGLAQSGKTTVFNSLTRGSADISSHAPGGISPHIGIAKVPEPRLKRLVDIFQPKRIVPAEVMYIDIGASLKNLATDKGIGGELLNQLSNTDTLINVVRAFPDDSIPHIEGNLDIERDIATIERRLEKINNSLKGSKQAERQGFLREQEILDRFRDDLTKDIPIRELKLTAEEARAISHYQFLTSKPILTVVNIGEEQLTGQLSLEAELDSRFSAEKNRIIALCGKLEMELSQLDDDAAQEFRSDFGLQESGLDRVIQASYQLLGLNSFFTAASNEVRAWSIPGGTSAQQAAGKIHTDMERGFIRAEAISYDDLVNCGSMAEARKQGRLRLEGKDYPIKDGDVINFLFNV
ncbi:redox-regulated ATPase YchF [Chloroflexota bacterium]